MEQGGPEDTPRSSRWQSVKCLYYEKNPSKKGLISYGFKENRKPWCKGVIEIFLQLTMLLKKWMFYLNQLLRSKLFLEII